MASYLVQNTLRRSQTSIGHLQTLPKSFDCIHSPACLFGVIIAPVRPKNSLQVVVNYPYNVFCKALRGGHNDCYWLGAPEESWRHRGFLLTSSSTIMAALKPADFPSPVAVQQCRSCPSRSRKREQAASSPSFHLGTLVLMISGMTA